MTSEALNGFERCTFPQNPRVQVTVMLGMLISLALSPKSNFTRSSSLFAAPMFDKFNQSNQPAERSIVSKVCKYLEDRALRGMFPVCTGVSAGSTSLKQRRRRSGGTKLTTLTSSLLTDPTTRRPWRRPSGHSITSLTRWARKRFAKLLFHTDSGSFF